MTKSKRLSLADVLIPEGCALYVAADEASVHVFVKSNRIDADKVLRALPERITYARLVDHCRKVGLGWQVLA